MPPDHEETSLHDSLDAAYNELESAPDTTPEPPTFDEPDTSAEPVEQAAEPDAASETDETNETDGEPPELEAQPPELADKPPEQEAPADEIEALIKESGVRSVRGQERIRKVFEARKEAEAKAQEYEQDITQFKDMLRQTRMDEQQFATVLEYGRLANSDNPQERALALQMLDQQRAQLAKELGVDLPGVDPLDDFPQLKASVENMDITREHALQLAKYQRQEHAQQQQRAAQAAQAQQAQQFQQQLGQVQTTAEAYFKTRAHESDYGAKMAQISAKFKDPAFVQEFVTTYEPRQWFGLLKMMYDQTQVVRPPAAPQNRPISARPAHTGAPSTQGLSLKDSLSAAADQLGI